MFETDICMVVRLHKEHLIGFIWGQMKFEKLVISKLEMYFQSDAKYLKGHYTCGQASAMTHDCPVV